MFDLGKKIIVIESSHRKVTNPRKGTTGYVSSCYGIRSFFNHNLCAMLCEIYFVKYGFEKQQRLEKRTVIAVVPIINRKRSDNVCQQIKTVKSKLIFESGLDTLNDIRAHFSMAIITPVVMLAPLEYDNTNLLTCHYKEFKAWVECHTSNDEFISYLNSSMQSGHYKNSNMPLLGNTSTWEILIKMKSKRSHRDSVIKLWYENSEVRQEAIKTLQAITTMWQRRKIKSITDEIHDCMMEDISHQNPDVQEVYVTICLYLFSDQIRSNFYDICSDIGTKAISDITEDIESIVLEYSAISTTVWKSGKHSRQSIAD